MGSRSGPSPVPSANSTGSVIVQSAECGVGDVDGVRVHSERYRSLSAVLLLPLQFLLYTYNAFEGNSHGLCSYC